MKHPAKYSPEVLDEFRRQLDGFKGLILDPFAGAGGIHDLAIPGQIITRGVELEPEWVAMHPNTMLGDATDLDLLRADAIVTSPCYGNRMADRDMRDSTAGTYMKALGREASDGSSCHLQWGDEYRDFHMLAWKEAVRVLGDGLFLLNISDHYRDFKRQKVVAWHVQALQSLGLWVLDVVPVATKRLKYGANSDSRMCAELVIRLQK